MEALFAELKNQIGLRRLRLRRLKFVAEQFLLSAAAQNMKRLVRFLSRTLVPPSLQPPSCLVGTRKNEPNLKTTRRVSSPLRKVFQHPRTLSFA